MNIDRFFTLVLVLAAVTLAGTRINGAVRPSVRIVDVDGPPSFVAAWESLLDIGRHAGGDSSAAIKILVFSDYECSACAAFHRTVSAFVAERPGLVDVRHVHFPLPMHRFALPAARAAECAANVGKFGDLVHLFYEKQDSLGLKSWISYAAEADIADPAKIEECAQTPGEFDHITAGLAAGDRLGVQGTPTTLINGWRFSAPPTPARMASAVDSILAGASPQ